MDFTTGLNSQSPIIAANEANGPDSNISTASTNNSSNAISTFGKQASSRSIRILTRRYKLTRGAYKYLEIGIKVSLPSSTVEIALGDNRGNEIVFNVEDWLRFVELRHLFSSILVNQINAQRNELAHLMSRVGNLSLKLDKFGNRRVLCIQSSNVSITMTYPTVQYMFVLAPCVAHTVESLSNMTNSVSTSLVQMRAIAANEPNVTSIPRKIRESNFFRSDSAIDCELLATIYERNAIPNESFY